MSTSVTIIIIEKTGQVKEQVIKNFKEEELYKKAGLKTNTHFKKYTEWNIENLNNQTYAISVYGKTEGNANQENKYDFPPPIDKTLFFGNCIIVNKTNDIPTNLTCKEWNAIYEYLFEGFEDIGDSDSTDFEDETDNDGFVLNKYGYAKDGFIVDDDDIDYEDDIDESDIDDEDSYKKKKVSKSKKVTKQPKKGKKIVTEVVEPTIIDSILKYTNELTEESYV